MARGLISSFSLLVLLFLNSNADAQWTQGKATWYGGRTGDGSDAGNCGYGVLTSSVYGSTIAAANPTLFQDGAGCGACYQVKCVNNPLCSTTPVTVTITDKCPECSATHLDLSGTSFGKMAVAGKSDQLLNVGILGIQFRRVPCNLGVSTISFRISPASSPYYTSILVRDQEGAGTVAKVELQQSGSIVWQELTHDWGANYVLHGPVKAPASLRVTAGVSGKVITCPGKIPANYSPGDIIRCGAQFSTSSM